MAIISENNIPIVEEFRANKGVVGGRFEGRTLLLVHNKGAKSGQERINPVAYVRDGEDYVIIASKGGAPTNPQWFYNLKAHPDVTVEVGTPTGIDTFPARAEQVTEEPERTRLYDKMVSVFPGFDDYRKRTTRVIPVFRLKKV